MSLVAKSKSKDKMAGKDQKSSSRSSATINVTAGMLDSAYNPFLTLDTSSTSSLPLLYANGQIRNVDESDDHSGSTHGSGAEYDSASNHDCRSVESEEHNKDKSSSSTIRQESVPGADNEKGERIRQKNERKHQRQKERRAQELHERCSGYLMSRKLETLAQQLVSMGFSVERATMALILNEGKVEEAVAWLFEDEEDAEKQNKDQNLDTGGNLKINISEELVRIAAMEAAFKCSKQEVERVVVSCEGDLDRAEETLRSQKQDPSSSALSKQEEIPDLQTLSNNGKVSVTVNQNSLRPQPKTSRAVAIQQPSMDERDFNYTRATVGSMPKMVSKCAQPSSRVQPKLESAGQPQQVAVMTPTTEKSWLAGGSTRSPLVSYSPASPLQVSPLPSKTESRYASVGNSGCGEFNNLNRGMVREPVATMQRLQCINDDNKAVTLVTSISSSPPGTALGRYPLNLDIMTKPNGIHPHIPNSRSLSPNNMSLSQFFPQALYQQQQQHQFAPRTSPTDQPGSCGITTNGLSNRIGPSPPLEVASSLGLFSGVGSACSTGSIPQVDWSTGGSMSSCDYNNIDWSLDRTSMSSVGKPMNGFWPGMSSFPKSNRIGGLHMYGPNASEMGVRHGIRQRSLNGNGVSLTGLQDVGPSNGDASSAGSREWASPFEEKDLFSLPRNYVSSPSL